MKVLIAGNPTRGKQWEIYLRKRSSVTEVIVTPEFQDEAVDAIVLLNDSPSKLILLLNIIRQGYPVYLVSHLSTEVDTLQKIYHAAEESNVSVQFSHWASFSTMTRWVNKNLGSAPRFIEFRKQERGRTIPTTDRFRQTWVDELAFITSLQKSSVQHITAHAIKLKGQPIGVYFMLRFDNGAVASMHYTGVSTTDYHERIIQSENSVFICDILNQKATRYTTSDDSKLLNADHQSFDSSTTAENSLEYFIRSIKTHKPSGFSSSTALQTARLANKIDDLLKRS
ncbi:hypothetical protein BH23BAC3_BH23BAC3_06950 [soil metagenome]